MRAGLRLAAAAAVLSCLTPVPAFAENRTTIQIATVLASNEGRVFDARLSSLKSELKQLRFRSYQMVSTETRVVRGNGIQSGIELPNGRYLHVTTREHTPSHLRLHILLNEDNRPVVNTYVKLELGSVVLLGGPRDENGTLVITIRSRPWREEDGGDDDDSPRRPSSSPDGVLPGQGGAAKPSDSLPPREPTPALSASMPGSALSAQPAK